LKLKGTTRRVSKVRMANSFLGQPMVVDLRLGRTLASKTSEQSDRRLFEVGASLRRRGLAGAVGTLVLTHVASG